MTVGLLRAELRKTTSTKLWWGLLIPVGLLSVLINLFGGLFTASLPDDVGGAPPLLLGSIAYAMGLTSVFALVHGVVGAAGEFRHRTITTTYLTAGRRWPVLLVKMAVSGAVGAGYALAAALLGLLAGLVADGGAFPPLGTLLVVTPIGMAVCALWGAFGAALGTAVSNQVSALVGALVYVLLAELLISAVLRNSDSREVQRISGFLPGNAGDVAIYDIPARVLAGPNFGPTVVETLAGVTAPPPWWGALLVLAAWTAAVGATAWVIAERRDVT